MNTLTNLLAADGLFDLGTEKIDGMITLLRGFSVLLGIGFLVYRGISSKGAIASIAVAALCGGLFIWAVFNVTAIQKRVDSEINAAASPSSVVSVVATGHGPGGDVL